MKTLSLTARALLIAALAIPLGAATAVAGTLPGSVSHAPGARLFLQLTAGDAAVRNPFAVSASNGPMVALDFGGTNQRPGLILIEDPDDPGGGDGDTTDPGVIPEPLTMTLLATGLAGMGGAGMVRRRKKKAEQQ